MEFIVQLSTPVPDVDAIDEALRSIDPAALVDADQSRLRIAGAFDARTLQVVLERAGQRVTSGQITQLPSVCCGGCSG